MYIKDTNEVKSDKFNAQIELDNHHKSLMHITNTPSLYFTSLIYINYTCKYCPFTDKTQINVAQCAQTENQHNVLNIFSFNCF